MKYSIVIAFIFLTGCTYLMEPDYDPKEYLLFVEYTADIKKLQDNCNKDQSVIVTALEELTHKGRILETYSEFLPNNAEVTKVVNIINNDINEMQEKQSLSEFYCKTKTKLMITKATRMLEVVARKRKE
jgi:hypothetical protein